SGLPPRGRTAIVRRTFGDMRRRRFIEGLGSFLVGAGLAAAVYETGLRRPGAASSAADATGPVELAATTGADALEGPPALDSAPDGRETSDPGPAEAPADAPATPGDPYTPDAAGTFVA